jgi:hypothetical protein
MTSGRVAVLGLVNLRDLPQACAIGVLVDHRNPNPATRGKLVYPMSGNLMFFEKINEGDCLST